MDFEEWIGLFISLAVLLFLFIRGRVEEHLKKTNPELYAQRKAQEEKRMQELYKILHSEEEEEKPPLPKPKKKKSRHAPPPRHPQEMRGLTMQQLEDEDAAVYHAYQIQQRGPVRVQALLASASGSLKNGVLLAEILNKPRALRPTPFE